MTLSKQHPATKSTGSGVVPPGEIEFELGVPIPGVILPPEAWTRTALKRLPAEGPLDWEALFGRQAPRVVDLGCGNGRFVVSSAVRRPELDHLGLDALPVVIRYATRRGNQRGLTNVRLAVGGAWEFLDRLTPPGTLHEIHLYHPQPFPERAESERRLVTPAFLALVHRSLTPDGKFFIQTDSREYGHYIGSVAPEFFAIHKQEGPWPEDPQGRTRREIIATQKGLPIFRAYCEKRVDLTAEQIAELVTRLPPPKFAPPRRHMRQRSAKRRR
jgi:tRNA (guanine-N7-)-methyltransferase